MESVKEFMRQLLKGKAPNVEKMMCPDCAVLNSGSTGLCRLLAV